MASIHETPDAQTAKTARFEARITAEQNATTLMKAANARRRTISGRPGTRSRSGPA